MAPRDHLNDLLAQADPEGPQPPLAAAQAAAQAEAEARRLGLAPEAWRAGAWRCAQLLRLGRHAELLQCAARLREERAAARVEVNDATHLELLRLVAMAASEASDFGQALDAAHALARLTAEHDDPSQALHAAIAESVCFERLGDSWQAMRRLNAAVARFGERAAPLPHLIAVNGLTAIAIGAFHRLSGCAPSAETHAMLQRARDTGERARQLLGRVPNTTYEVAVLGNLGEIYTHLGELAQAGSLLQRARATASEQGRQAHLWRVQASIGQWLLATAQAEPALREMQALLATMGADPPLVTALRAHHVAYQACRELRRYPAALEHLEAVERLERQRTTTQLQAQSTLFISRTEAQRAQWQAEQAHAAAQQEASRQRQRADAALQAAERDPLTGLGNRRHLERCFAELLPHLQREGAALALAVLDLDHFKPVNDGHGHAAGDQVLSAVAQMLRENMRTGDVLARLGGEEFVIVLPETPPAQARETCERLRERIAALRFQGLPDALHVTASIGLAAAPPFDGAALLARADRALYEAKRAGRNCVSTAPD